MSRQAQPPTLLLTKLHPPFVPAQTVARERLFARLGEGRGRRLTLVACPAGFGKSTLLAAWREHELAHRPVAWVTLDGGDDDTVVLWSHIVEALCRACPGLAHEELAAAAAGAPLLEVALPRLVNALLEQEDVVLVLDDFHRLSVRPRATASPGSSSTCPRRSSSCSPPAPTRRSRSARCAPTASCVELRADDLRFTLDEAGEFLNARLGLELAADDVELLVARTEGWPAGIYLAALSLTGKDDKPALVRAFDGTSAHVVDFLSTEVLDGFEPELQAFMLRTSVLERLCAPLCDAVVGEPVSAAALESLARTNLFLLPLDDRREWFRFHHLFAQLLRVELERREPASSCRSCTPARTRGTASTARPTRRSSTRSRPARTPRRGS